MSNSILVEGQPVEIRDYRLRGGRRRYGKWVRARFSRASDNLVFAEVDTDYGPQEVAVPKSDIQMWRAAQ